MKLNHLNLCVPDITEARTFFESHFGFRCVDIKGANILAVLQGEGDFILVLSNLRKDVKPAYPADFHIGFILESVDQVQAIYQRLQEAGIEIPQGIREMRGSLIFYCIAPGPILLEVSCRL